MTRAWLVLPLLAACGGDPIPPTAESCAAICTAAGTATPKVVAETPKPAAAPKAGAGTMSAFEQQHLGPVLSDLRDGVRPFDDKSVGLCKGTDKCDKFIGLDAKELAPGDYILQAVLAVPALGEDWSVELATDCKTTKGDNTSSKQNAKSYPLSYAGPDRGYKLVPLRKITSPGKYGAQECSYTLTAPHPDGDKVITGSWSVPG